MIKLFKQSNIDIDRYSSRYRYLSFQSLNSLEKVDNRFVWSVWSNKLSEKNSSSKIRIYYK